MRLKIILLLVPAQILAIVACGAVSIDRRLAAEEVMRRANDYFQANFSIGTAVWDRSAYHTGNMRVWETLGIQSYYDRSVAWGEANSWLRGPEGISHADAHCCGQTYIDLYNADPQPIRTNSITSTMDYVLTQTNYENDWSWIDAFYMAAPTLARLGVLNADENYFSALYDMYLDMKINRGLFDPVRGLWWRDGNYTNTDTYWGRGNGWVIAACARVLEQLPVGDPRRPEFESMLQTMATALLQWQQPDGFWRSDIINPSNYPTPETSCTAFFTYAIAYGINEGILVDSPGTNYTAAVTNAWDGMVAIALHENGKLGYAQNIGAAPGPSTYDNDKDYAYGAFLLAGCEILRMFGGPVPVSPDAGADAFLIDYDGDYAESVTLSASNSVFREGTAMADYSWSWWSGPVLLGTGTELAVDFPLGINAVVLKAADGDGNVYHEDAATIEVAPPRIVVSASGYESGSTNFPENTLDGNLGSRWSQNGSDGSQWIQYDLPQTTAIDHVDIAFYNGASRQARFAVWLSGDGSVSNLVRVLPPSGNPADYVSSSGTTLDLETFGFPVQPVKAIRIQGWGNSQSTWNSITETAIPIAPLPVLQDQTDGDGNGLPDSWEIHHFGATGQVASVEIGGTGITLGEAYVLGLDPVTPDTSAMIGINVVSNQPVLSVQTAGAFGVGYQGLVRKYSILATGSLTNETWSAAPGYSNHVGDNMAVEIGITNTAPSQCYRIQSWLE